jgi:hypothetical protein
MRNLPAFVVGASSFRGFLKAVRVHGDKKVDPGVIQQQRDHRIVTVPRHQVLIKYNV